MNSTLRSGFHSWLLKENKQTWREEHELLPSLVHREWAEATYISRHFIAGLGDQNPMAEPVESLQNRLTAECSSSYVEWSVLELTAYFPGVVLSENTAMPAWLKQNGLKHLA